MAKKYKNFKEFLKKAEYPFIRHDMTEEEFDAEYEYFVSNYEKVKDGTYEPLWKNKGFN